MSTAVYLCSRYKKRNSASRWHYHAHGANIDGAPPEMSREMGMQAASFACEPEVVADVIVFLASARAHQRCGYPGR